MTMNPLPPQAYTKETLLKAYQWLMSQNSNIKEIATTPDMLVSLYLKATRDGESALERPSIKNFKSELKSLAGLMGELDRPQQQQHHHSNSGAGATYHPPVQQVLQPQAAQVMPQPVQPVAQTVVHAQQAPAPAVLPAVTTQTLPPQTHQVSYTEKTLTATTQSSHVMDVFDCGTKLMIQEVKEEFNLSSDLEALRMLIKIGYVKSKGMLK
ncbi:hypothetical protein [Bdellovibrio sp. HCB274]|uniref:hypothetical protein n=1 Tax=Bdellovibrio sp. HCB274 TaxID=3394361 RepID=UPI0039B41348